MNARSRYVLDTGVFPLILAGDSRLKSLVADLQRGNAVAFACEPNLAELYDKICESKGREVADLTDRQIRRQEQIVSVAPEEEMSRLAGKLKCAYRGKVSLADCYAAATASLQKARLMTTDANLEKMARREGIKTLLLSYDLSPQ